MILHYKSIYGRGEIEVATLEEAAKETRDRIEVECVGSRDLHHAVVYDGDVKVAKIHYNGRVEKF
jgi:hypothetical protein